MGLVEKKPKGLLRWLLRAPIALYKIRLGWLMGGHFLMLTTCGRVSGKARHAVVEVVDRDRDTGTYYIASGWGFKSDWYQNILKTPQVRVDVGCRRYVALAKPLAEKEAAAVLSVYARRFPVPFRFLSSTLTGTPMSGTPEECAHLVKSVPLVALPPIAKSYDKQSNR